MSDLVERLRANAVAVRSNRLPVPAEFLDEAADEIERLRALRSDAQSRLRLGDRCAGLDEAVLRAADAWERWHLGPWAQAEYDLLRAVRARRSLNPTGR